MSPLVKNDQKRVQALRDLNLLDGAPDSGLDRLTAFCANLFGTSFAFVSLIDEDRQWFISAHGTEIRETSRGVSFCDHAIAAEGMLYCPDTLADERFASNPLVTGAPHVRSYLGQPIRSPDGFLLGALCVIDQRPREFDDAAREQLRELAKIAEDLINARLQSSLTAQLNQLLWRETNELKKANRLLGQAGQIGKIGAWELRAGTLDFSDEMYAIAEVEPCQPIDAERALLFYQPDDRSRIEQILFETVRDGTPFDYEVDFVTDSGTVKRIRCTGERFDGDRGEEARVVGVVRDITEAHHAELALKRAADHDSLTGIYNRHAFDRDLQSRIKEHRATGTELCLILLDLDGFKEINDQFGHVTGDVVLEDVSSRLRAITPEGAVLARWGGDEFALLPPAGTPEQAVHDLALELITAIGPYIEVGGYKVRLTGTCGVARFAREMGARELVRRADLALYHGKNCERSTVHHYSPALDRKNEARQEAIHKVQTALDDDRLFAAYQPIVDLRTREIIGMEALMRLNTPAGVRLTATEVLPGLMDPLLSRRIAERMLRSLCLDLPKLEQAQPGLRYVSINLTEADLLSRDFTAKFLPLVRESCIDPRKITVEITETMLLVHDNATVRKVLGELHLAGVRVALDDFGTGYSSLSHLREFPIDKVKIDKSFIRDMCTDWQSRTIVQALISMARNMRIEVVAEGVETAEQLALLQNLGCEMGQGFLFSPALDLGRATLANFTNARMDEQRKLSA